MDDNGGTPQFLLGELMAALSTPWPLSLAAVTESHLTSFFLSLSF